MTPGRTFLDTCAQIPRTMATRAGTMTSPNPRSVRVTPRYPTPAPTSRTAKSDAVRRTTSSRVMRRDCAAVADGFWYQSSSVRAEASGASTGRRCAELGASNVA